MATGAVRAAVGVRKSGEVQRGLDGQVLPNVTESLHLVNTWRTCENVAKTRASMGTQPASGSSPPFPHTEHTRPGLPHSSGRPARALGSTGGHWKSLYGATTSSVLTSAKAKHPFSARGLVRH